MNPRRSSVRRFVPRPQTGRRFVPRPHAGPRVLLTTVASDAHTWNLVYLSLLLKENGYEVSTLGACPPVPTVVAAARELRPSAIVVSTVNGHGCIDGIGLVQALRRVPVCQDVAVAIGGKLGIAGDIQQQQVARLYGAGCDRVFGDGDGPTGLLSWLSEATATVELEQALA